MERIVFAYSGSAASSVALAWLAEHESAEIVAMTIDLGQGRDLDGARGRATQLGAVRAHVLDLREAFARDYLLRALQAGAFDDGREGLSAALPAPLLAAHVVEIAHIEGASAIAHACAAESAAAARFEASVRAIDPAIAIIGVARRAGLTSAAAAAFAQAHGITMPAESSAPRVTAHVGSRTIAGGPVASAAGSAAWPDELFERTKAPGDAPDCAATVEVTFEHGVPVAVNGVAMSLTEVIDSLETIAGSHGVGRLDVGGTPRAGASARAVVEAPALVVLRVALRAIEAAVAPRDLTRISATLGRTYGEILDHARWRSLTREAIDAFVARVQDTITGTVRLQLHRGACQVVGPIDTTSREIDGDASVRPPADPSGVPALGDHRAQAPREATR